MRIPRFRVIAAAATVLAIGTATAAYADPSLLWLGTSKVGRQDDGSVITSTGQRVTPAGATAEFTGRPVDEAIRPDHKTATLLNAQGSLLVVVDLATHKVLQNLSVSGQSASFGGVAYSPDGNQLFASAANGAIVRATVKADGTLTAAKAISLPQTNGNPYPGGLAVSADGKSLYVAMSRNNTLGVLDLATEKMTQQIPVGNAPHAVVVKDGSAYVTNQGGRPAQAGDTTVDSAGTKIVADPVTGGPSTGTVSVVDLTSAKTVGTIPVGLQPTGEAVHGEAVFVTNTSSDTISVIDTTQQHKTQTIDVQPLPHLPAGSQPNGVTFVGDNQLVVSLGRTNALALYKWTGFGGAPEFLGMVPTGWYPTAVLPADGGGFVVANGKGVGSLGPANANGGRRVQALIGSVQFVPKPTSDALGTYTSTVLANNNLNASTAYDNARPNRAPVPVPERIGEPSKIKHVFYIIKENRTYDQILGDVGKGDSEPKLTEFGKDVTPNQHAMMERFPLMDNFYADGDLSADGHQWAMQANVPDYLEKAFGDFVRSYPYDGGDSMAYLPTGFIWGNARKAGKTVADFGEYVPTFSGSGTFGRWADWYHDAQVMAGEATGPLHAPPHTFQAKADVPGLDPLLIRDYPNFNTAIPDQYRYQIFRQQFAQWQAKDNLPNLTIMTLGDDHTSGSSANDPTPRAQVADNDLALGKIVDDISHSRYWKDSAIFVTEDDSQAGTDHVDGHRTTGYVISPWTKTGAVDSQYYTQVNMVRTIEQILGLPPMNQMDLAAPPMTSLFSTRPNFAPYDAVANKIPLDEMNPGSLPPGSAPPVAPALCSSAAPSATMTSTAPAVNAYRSDESDYQAGDTYGAARNGCVEVDVTKRVGENNKPGTFQPGWPANVTLRDGAHTETLDWSELILSAKMDDPAVPWHRSGEWLTLPDVTTSGSSVVSSGTAQVNPDIKATLTTSAVPGQPVVKETLQLHNAGSTDFSGYFQYLLDPDSVEDTAILPGVSGTNKGFVTSGWTKNYVYDGPSTAIYSPAQGIAWDPDNKPTGIMSAGYIVGTWFDASVQAGGDRTITWYHVTDYPAQGSDVTANIARWADAIAGGPVPTGGSVAATKALKIVQPTGIQKQWLEASNAMGFNDPTTPPDATDRNLLNHAIWYATEGYDTPYPGESRVLAPSEVPRVEGITDPEDQFMQPFRMSPEPETTGRP